MKFHSAVQQHFQTKNTSFLTQLEIKCYKHVQTGFVLAFENPAKHYSWSM